MVVFGLHICLTDFVGLKKKYLKKLIVKYNGVIDTKVNDDTDLLIYNKTETENKNYLLAKEKGILMETFEEFMIDYSRSFNSLTYSPFLPTRTSSFRYYLAEKYFYNNNSAIIEKNIARYEEDILDYCYKNTDKLFDTSLFWDFDLANLNEDRLIKLLKAYPDIDITNTRFFTTSCFNYLFTDKYNKLDKYIYTNKMEEVNNYFKKTNSVINTIIKKGLNDHIKEVITKHDFKMFKANIIDYLTKQYLVNNPVYSFFYEAFIDDLCKYVVMNYMKYFKFSLDTNSIEKYYNTIEKGFDLSLDKDYSLNKVLFIIHDLRKANDKFANYHEHKIVTSLLNELSEKYDGEVDKSIHENFNIGEVVTLGNYQYTNMYWHIINEDKDSYTLLLKDSRFYSKYSDFNENYNDSLLKKELNGTIYNTIYFYEKFLIPFEDGNYVDCLSIKEASLLNYLDLEENEIFYNHWLKDEVDAKKAVIRNGANGFINVDGTSKNTFVHVVAKIKVSKKLSLTYAALEYQEV